MKYIYKILPIIIILIYGCSTNTKEKIADNNPCLDGYIFITYVGETNKPSYSYLLRTNGDDSTFYNKYIDKFVDDDFSIEKYLYDKYTRNTIINKSIFQAMKKYIVNHKTKVYMTLSDENNLNPTKIILLDQCDSLAYIVNKADTRYFSNLIDSVKRFNNVQLEKNLLYYKSIQEFDVEYLHKVPN